MDLHTLRIWLERRFWDFRYGHGTYLAYAIGLFNFIILNYYLLISNIPFLQRIFPHLWVFALAFTPTYFFLAIIVGWKFYRKKQYKTDAEVAAAENPFRFRVLVPSRETVLDLPLNQLELTLLMRLLDKEGLVTPKEKAEFENYMRMMERLRQGKSLDEKS